MYNICSVTNIQSHMSHMYPLLYIDSVKNKSEYHYLTFRVLLTI